ncbi:NAD(P)H-dependent oxidoreductase [Halobacillus locisalis]|uniref:NAD(P)H-dependent oxidoreductase n=1 Tax=Halobacillus locisalis TaxID=220753 RepID=A0A838CVP4_9BACI|nr:NADPH-dependent FMN reductase [Halobacillus locisalis]MBA2176008.1 NAD(P)H-dependent oxidoreductase [Halobacillus locisalis]
MTEKNLRIVTILGSLRKESYNKILLQAIADKADQKWDISSADISELPLFNQDIEADGDPEAVTTFKETIKQADGVVIVTPEYNSGIPGVLKNALDWGSRPGNSSVFMNTPVAIAGATPGGAGTALAQMQVRQTLAAMNANVMSHPKVLVGGVQNKIDFDSGRIEDSRTISRLEDFVHTFTSFVEMYQQSSKAGQ